MLWIRNVKASTHKLVGDWLKEPPADYVAAGIPAYNVYGETQFRDIAFQPTKPFIYLVDVGITLSLQKLPCIVVEFQSHVGMVGQLGDSHRWKHHEVSLHVHGRNRGERDDVAAYLSEMLAAITIYDLTQSPAVEVETVPFDDTVGVANVNTGDEASEEGTLLNWALVTFKFTTERI